MSHVLYSSTLLQIYADRISISTRPHRIEMRLLGGTPHHIYIKCSIQHWQLFFKRSARSSRKLQRTNLILFTKSATFCLRLDLIIFCVISLFQIICSVGCPLVCIASSQRRLTYLKTQVNCERSQFVCVYKLAIWIRIFLCSVRQQSLGLSQKCPGNQQFLSFKTSLRAIKKW